MVQLYNVLPEFTQSVKARTGYADLQKSSWGNMMRNGCKTKCGVLKYYEVPYSPD